MTIKEVVKSKLWIDVPDSAINVAIIEAEASPDDEYGPSKEVLKAVDMALASVILVLLTKPKTITQLDFTITMQDAKTLAQLRRSLLAKWGEEDFFDDSGVGEVRDLSNRW